MMILVIMNLHTQQIFENNLKDGGNNGNLNKKMHEKDVIFDDDFLRRQKKKKNDNKNLKEIFMIDLIISRRNDFEKHDEQKDTDKNLRL